MRGVGETQQGLLAPVDQRGQVRRGLGEDDRGGLGPRNTSVCSSSAVKMSSTGRSAVLEDRLQQPGAVRSVVQKTVDHANEENGLPVPSLNVERHTVTAAYADQLEALTAGDHTT